VFQLVTTNYFSILIQLEILRKIKNFVTFENFEKFGKFEKIQYFKFYILNFNWVWLKDGKIHWKIFTETEKNKALKLKKIFSVFCKTENYGKS